jgi:hypothetical protein
MSKIKIKEENKGKFSSWAASRGMSVQQAASKVLANRSQYSAALIKRANFAHNAAKWDEGGQFSMGGIMSIAQGALGIVQQIQQDVENKRLLEEQNKQKAIGMADAGQASIGNNFPSVFKFGGQFKGKKFGGQPNAIVGGDEIVITPDGVPTNMKGPSDMNGGQGIDVALPDQTIILSKKNSKDLLPLTNKINKSNEVLKGNAVTMFAKNSAKRNLDKYMSTMMDAYSEQEMKKQMKMSKGGKFDGGGGFRFYEKNNPYQAVMPSDPLAKYIWNNPNGSQQQPYTLGNVGVSANRTPITPLIGTQGGSTPRTGVSNSSGPDWGEFGALDTSLAPSTPGTQDLGFGQPDMGSMNNWQNDNVQFSNPKDNPNSDQFVGGGIGNKDNKFGDVLSGIGEMAPMLYNLGRGLFGKKDTVNDSRYANPYEGQINSLMANRRYNIDAGLAGNEASYRTNAANMRNLGGSRGQVMGNLTGAQNAKQFADMALYGQQSNMNNQYKGEQANMMYGLGRDTVATRMNTDEGNRMTDAAKNNMVGAGMSGLQQYLLTRRQMKGQAGRDKLLINAIKAYSPYSSKWIPGLDALGR